MSYRITKSTSIVHSADAWPGTIRVARWIADDIAAVVSGTHTVTAYHMQQVEAEATQVHALADEHSAENDLSIFFATAQHDALAQVLLEEIAAVDAEVESNANPSVGSHASTSVDACREILQGHEQYCIRGIPCSRLTGKPAIVIVGSDKRGTIYGLMHLSRLMGVSPLRRYNGVEPMPRDEVVLTQEELCITAPQPSVKYRGYFINDEWPAFGNWSRINFGGANAQCYEALFEVLLRLKGNYMWPAMWIDNFSLDGPGLASAQLADELGIVMSTSHHEPCMRTGEEYTLMRGPDSPYGDAWDFISNREGITQFWRDGLRRNAPFSNVITMGMRGEHDTPIMGEASKAENIALLKDVLHTQNQLMKEEICEDLHAVPRQIVLFNEVESFFFPYDDTESSLIDDPELEGVTIVLSDNNVGYTRMLPQPKYRHREGGYGMYYHMDMHGGPMSYEWVGSTALTRVWDQMSTAWDWGIRDIWITNGGDLATNECALSYFLSMANDMDAHSSAQPQDPSTYLHQWVLEQFGDCIDAGALTSSEVAQIEQVLRAMTRMAERCKHEVMNVHTYHPTHYGEAQVLLEQAQWVLDTCQRLRNRMPEQKFVGFMSLVWYPACATANLMKVWVLAGRNAWLADIGAIQANVIADEIAQCIEQDQVIVETYHQLADGKFDGLGLSEHFGYTNWSADDNRYPQRHYIEPSLLPRMIVTVDGIEAYSTGSRWLNQHLTLCAFNDPTVNKSSFTIYSGSRMPIQWRVSACHPALHISRYQGVTSSYQTITVTLDRSQVNDGDVLDIEIVGPIRKDMRGYKYQQMDEEQDSLVYIHIPVAVRDACAAAGPQGSGTLQLASSRQALDVNGVVVLEAHAASACSGGTQDAEFQVIEEYGLTASSVRMVPTTLQYDTALDIDEASLPWLEYQCTVSQGGAWQAIWVLAPTMPVDARQVIAIATRVNNGELVLSQGVKDQTQQFYMGEQYTQEQLHNIRMITVPVQLQQGSNTVKFYPLSANTVLERLVLVREGVELPESYLGPRATPWV